MEKKAQSFDRRRDEGDIQNISNEITSTREERPDTRGGGTLGAGEGENSGSESEGRTTVDDTYLHIALDITPPFKRTEIMKVVLMITG